MPFQFPDPSVATTATLPNGEIWEYINGAWQARPTQDDDQQQIDALETRITINEDDIGDLEGLDINSAISLLQTARQDIIDLKSKVNTLELTSFLIME
jgi:archaellum component FlaC